MIISASYKTDIPAFYGKWFKNRIKAGYCKMINPYNQKQVVRVDLTLPNVDGFIFWTKNIGPFLNNLEGICTLGYPFIVQYTINSYSQQLETSVVNSSLSIQYMKILKDRYGPFVPVWRYDPIIISTHTSLDFHRKNFASLAKQLRGVTNEVVISFAQIYKKTQQNMDKAAQKHNFAWENPRDEIKVDLIHDLAQIAHEYEIQLSICSQKDYLSQGTTEATCIDAERLSKIVGHPILVKRKGNRGDCQCFVSRDIGEYDTCPHGCVYCYAVSNRKTAIQHYKEHDPYSEFLFNTTTNEGNNSEGQGIIQGQLFE